MKILRKRKKQILRLHTSIVHPFYWERSKEIYVQVGDENRKRKKKGVTIFIREKDRKFTYVVQCSGYYSYSRPVVLLSF